MNPSDEHSDSVFYGIAAEEIQAGKVDKGLMAKAIAKADGDKNKAEVLYLEWSVCLLKEEALVEQNRREAENKSRQREEAKIDTRTEIQKSTDEKGQWLLLIIFAIFVITILTVHMLWG